MPRHHVKLRVYFSINSLHPLNCPKLNKRKKGFGGIARLSCQTIRTVDAGILFINTECRDKVCTYVAEEHGAAGSRHGVTDASGATY